MSKAFSYLTVAYLLLSMGDPTRGGTVQWDFNGDLSSSTGGLDLSPRAATPATAPKVEFTTQLIDGSDAEVASFSRGTYFRMTHNFPPNGGGIYLNQYTLIMDVMFPDRSPSGGWASLWQTSLGDANDGDWFIHPPPGSGVGINGVYGGSVPDGVWHRLALVVDCVAGSFTSYVDGSQVQQLLVQQYSELSRDGRFSLDPAALLFADENGDCAAGFVNSVQLRDSALISDELLALGGPTAEGIPLPADQRDCVFRNFIVHYDSSTNSVVGTWRLLPGDQGFRVFEGARKIGGDLPASAVSFTDLSPPAAGAAVKYTLQPLLGGNVDHECVSEEIQTFACASELRATVVPGTRHVALAWKPEVNTGFTGYDLLRNGRSLATLGPGESSYLDRRISSGGSYTYRLVPIGPDPSPCPPATLRCRAVVPGDDALFFDDFERYSSVDELLAAGWEVHDENSPVENAAWTILNPGERGNPPGADGVPSSGKFLVSDSDAADGENTAGTGMSHDIWSPVIDASGRDSVWLHMDCSAMLNNNGDAVFLVSVSTDGGDSWEEGVFYRVSPGRSENPFPSVDLPEGAPGGPQVGTADGLYGPLDIDLSDLARNEPSVRFRLRHYEPNDDWWIAVDNVLVDSTPASGGSKVVLAREGFDGGIPGDWSVYSDLGGSAPWTAEDPCSISLFKSNGGVFPDAFDGRGLHHLGSAFAMVAPAEATCTAVPQDEWLTTPVLDCSGFGEVHLHVKSDLLVTDAVAEVLLSTDGGATFDRADPIFTYNTDDDSLVRLPNAEVVYNDLVLAIGRAAGERQAVIAFHYANPNAQTGFWAIDDVAVTAEARVPFHRGDANGLGGMDLTDVIYLLSFLFLDGPAPPCAEAADANDDGAIDVSDPLRLLVFFFLGGPALPDPGPVGRPCGPDTDPPGSPGDLGCASYSNCP